VFDDGQQVGGTAGAPHRMRPLRVFRTIKAVVSAAKLPLSAENRSKREIRQSFIRVYFACHSALTGNMETGARLRGFLQGTSMLSFGNPCQAPHSVISTNFRVLPGK
jgi:hypothetical protein